MARTLVILIAILLLPGCMTVAPLVVSGVGSGATYSLFSTAYKTETFSLNTVYRACMQALRAMEIRAHTISRKGPEITVAALAGNHKVFLELETITPATTRVIIKVSKAFLFRDKATAEEIIHQMSLALKNNKSRHPRRLASLAVSIAPPEASIRIMNIKPPFYQGIVLKPGVYDLAVSAENYRRKKILVSLRPGQDKIIRVDLRKTVQ